MIGFKIIKEMSRDELIDEILEGQRRQLQEKEPLELKAMVVEFRVMYTREALTKEAGITINSGPFGTTALGEDDE